MRLSDIQVCALAQLVNSFSKKFKEEHKNLLYADGTLAPDSIEMKGDQSNSCLSANCYSQTVNYLII